MAQNLNYKVDSSWWYNNSVDSGVKYGRLYKWAAALGLNDSCDTSLCASQVKGKRQGACPAGWHVPRNAEWNKLTDTSLAATTAGTKLKASTNLWSTNTGTDDYGFSVLPAGSRGLSGSSYGFGGNDNFWTASEYVGSSAWGRGFYGGGALVYRSDNNKSAGYSLRCLQD
jgi:uncharacterized protein (TIGR02145 family)